MIVLRTCFPSRLYHSVSDSGLPCQLRRQSMRHQLPEVCGLHLSPGPQLVEFSYQLDQRRGLGSTRAVHMGARSEEEKQGTVSRDIMSDDYRICADQCKSYHGKRYYHVSCFECMIGLRCLVPIEFKVTSESGNISKVTSAATTQLTHCRVRCLSIRPLTKTASNLVEANMRFAPNALSRPWIMLQRSQFRHRSLRHSRLSRS